MTTAYAMDNVSRTAEQIAAKPLWWARRAAIARAVAHFICEEGQTIKRDDDRDPSLVQDAAGVYHLFFSRWPISRGFEAWVTHSEVCRARAETPLGPFSFAGVVLARRPGWWDGDVTHNPTIKCFDGRYHLYYTGNHGGGEWWDHRNHQRIGLAVADRPEGPWRRSDRPLLEVTPGAWDATVVTNPSCDRTPDGRFILMYKGVGDRGPAPTYGPVLHGIACADDPAGPFIKHPTPIFAKDGADFPGEDPFVWCQDGRYHALLKDMGTAYSPSSRAIVRFASDDGLDWRIADPAVVQERMLLHADGRRQEIHRLERPFIHLEHGRPCAFLCAIKPQADHEHSQIVALGVGERRHA